MAERGGPEPAEKKEVHHELQFQRSGHCLFRSAPHGCVDTIVLIRRRNGNHHRPFLGEVFALDLLEWPSLSAYGAFHRLESSYLLTPSRLVLQLGRNRTTVCLSEGDPL